MKEIEIRAATDADVVPLSSLIRRTIRKSNAKDYDQHAIDELCSMFEPGPLAERVANEQFYICYLNNNLVGVVGLRREYVRSLFVEPSHQGQGLGKALVEKIEEVAKHNAVSELMVRSSTTARQFYEILGYKFIEHQSYSGGPFVLMMKSLT